MKKYLLEPGMYIEFGIATLLFLANVILAAVFPYFTVHKAYFEPAPYIIVLVIIYLLYVIRVHVGRKKSASDIAVLVNAFFLLWEFRLTETDTVVISTYCLTVLTTDSDQ